MYLKTGRTGQVLEDSDDDRDATTIDRMPHVSYALCQLGLHT